MTAERRTPNSARRFSTDVFAVAFSAPEAVGVRPSAFAKRVIGKLGSRSETSISAKNSLVTIGKNIHHRTELRRPRPLTLLVTQAVKRVFEPLLSCFQFDGQI
jgi:hypothetical protein